MSAAPTPTVPTAEQFTQASRALQGARTVYRDAAKALAKAKYDLELKKVPLLRAGVQGSNQEQREAELREGLTAEYKKVDDAETTLTDARTELENAVTVWDCLRYQLRLTEVETAELRRAA